MPKAKITDAELLAGLRDGQTVAQIARRAGIVERALHRRIARFEAHTGERLRCGTGTRTLLRGSGIALPQVAHSQRPAALELRDGVVAVASDCHYWPGDPSAAHRAFVRLLERLQPDVVIINGDEFDGAQISRHARIGWDVRPTVADELRAVQNRLAEIVRATPQAQHLATFGNHTLRFDTYLASNAALVEGVPQMRYTDHLPDWTYAWAWMFNGHTLVKHRIASGLHATWNNTQKAHVSTVTGHLHSLKVTPNTTMSPVNNGTIYGVDCGMLADPWGPQFDYMEQGPRNWRAGCAVLTFVDGELMPPELMQVLSPDRAIFRGTITTL